MKKAIILIAALLMIGSLAFADASFGIWGRTRFAFAQGDQRTTTAPPQPWQNWNLWGNDGPQMQFNYSWSNDKLGYVFKIVVNGSGWGTGYDAYGGNGIQKAYGTLKLVPGLLTIHIGYMQDYDQFRYEGGMQIDTRHTNDVGRFNGWGLIAVVAPKDTGFVIAGQYRLEKPAGDYDGGTNPDWAGGDGQTSLMENLNNMSIAAEIQIPDLLKIQAGLVRHGNKQGGNETYPGISYNSPVGAYHIFLRLHMLAVSGLTLVLTNDISAVLENQIAFPNTFIKETLYVRYAIQAFAIALTAEADIGMAKVSGGNTTIDLVAILEPSYNLGPITLGLGVEMQIPTSYSVGVSPTDGMKLWFQPWVLINDFATRIWIDYTMNPDRVNATNDYQWAVKADFTWSF